LKKNYFGFIAGIVAFVSVFLPWFTIELWTSNLSSTMNFAANLYQLTGTVEGLTKSMLLTVWFNAGPLILMLITGVLCIVSSIFAISRRRRTALLFVSCVFALFAMVIFGYGLANSSFAVEELNPGYTISQFSENSFALSAEQSMQNTYDYSWQIGIGFWLALTVVIFSLLAILNERIAQKHLKMKQ
jgi:hypothetical protein